MLVLPPGRWRRRPVIVIPGKRREVVAVVWAARRAACAAEAPHRPRKTGKHSGGLDAFALDGRRRSLGRLRFYFCLVVRDRDRIGRVFTLLSKLLLQLQLLREGKECP